MTKIKAKAITKYYVTKELKGGDMPRKGTRKSTHCRQLDFSHLIEIPARLECKLGHSVGDSCDGKGRCLDYKYSWVISLEQVRENLNLT